MHLHVFVHVDAHAFSFVSFCVLACVYGYDWKRRERKDGDMIIVDKALSSPSSHDLGNLQGCPVGQCTDLSPAVLPSQMPSILHTGSLALPLALGQTAEVADLFALTSQALQLLPQLGCGEAGLQSAQECGIPGSEQRCFHVSSTGIFVVQAMIATL